MKVWKIILDLKHIIRVPVHQFLKTLLFGTNMQRETCRKARSLHAKSPLNVSTWIKMGVYRLSKKSLLYVFTKIHPRVQEFLHECRQMCGLGEIGGATQVGDKHLCTESVPPSIFRCLYLECTVIKIEIARKHQSPGVIAAGAYKMRFMLTTVVESGPLGSQYLRK